MRIIKVWSLARLRCLNRRQAVSRPQRRKENAAVNVPAASERITAKTVVRARAPDRIKSAKCANANN